MGLRALTLALGLMVLLPSGGAADAAAKAAPGPPPQVTLQRLLEEMVDLTHWTRFPSPPYRHRLASSTDPSATTPDVAETWFKNVDAGHYVAVEERDGRTEYVALDAKGPGVVMRIWSATPKGKLRIYIDDMDEPAVEEDMSLLLTGKVPPFTAPFAYVAARGANLYFPFAFSTRCKVTLEVDDAFYQVNYRIYQPGVTVEPFSRTRLAAARDEMNRVASVLDDPTTAYRPSAAAQSTAFANRVEIDGPGMVRRLELRPSKTDADTLRSRVLVVRADGEETVRVPLGDFFGSGPGLVAFETIATDVSDAGVFTSRWPMPFARSLTLLVEGAGPGEVEGRIWHEPWSPEPDGLRFHAAWRHDHATPSWPPRDWTLADIRGRGVYAGTLLEIANSSKGWWGEGDEKIWVDDEAFPSHFGTGTEDYFGYAWTTPAVFVRPYHSQTRADGPGGYGYFSMQRWHLLDPIPFTSSLRFDQEIWHWSRSASLSLSAIAYYYAAPGASDDGLAPAAGEVPVPVVDALPVKRVPGAQEGETMAARTSGGKAAPENMVRYLGSLWSGDRHLAWHGAKPGDRLALRFEAPAEGRYRVYGYFTKARDYGIHRLLVNGEVVGEPVDFWSPIVATADDVDLGVHTLRKGANVLGVEVVGAGAKAEGTAFGLDCLRLVQVE